MPTGTTTSHRTARPTPPPKAKGKPLAQEPSSVETRCADAVRELERRATRATLEGMSRYAIPSDHALGVAMKDIQSLAKQLGHDHALAAALWDTGIYEARTLAAYVADPARVTAAQMDRWCRDLDNWAICDTVCFVLFDRAPKAFAKVESWAGKRDEIQKRAAFALLASIALHGRAERESDYLRGLALIEREAADERNFVRKGMSWALRSIGRRGACRKQAIALAERLAASDIATERWLGKDALRDLRKLSAKTK
ncbi:DNA alkylation repair protein [Lysobacter panacisoli]|uniref:DNA alkylation repair protein n=1 Tax=Lysobacter panacisoli TaxID=1255263 RepID=A0ABP9LA34_9GAMM|nr:DNA alkylation repair protein [Lysobacter panacisoli]